MIDVQAVLDAVDLVEVVARYISLRKSGSEWEGLCPFHDERSPSFTVSPAKGFVHCFGCGAHYDAIGFLRRIAGVSFVDACAQLGGRQVPAAAIKSSRREQQRFGPSGEWVPVFPSADAPRLAAGERCSIWNPKRNRPWSFAPTRADAYRDASGRLMGYVLRTEIVDRATGRSSKITPQVTWCIGPDGTARWCLRPFGTPRPLCGLDDLAARPQAPVLIVEGEKCRAAAAAALPMYAAVTWPGGSKGIARADWSPLSGRELVLWPDADDAGRQAMIGYIHHDGRFIDGVAQLVRRAGCASIRMVDPIGRPKGWDLADALDEGWTPKQLAAWAALHVKDVDFAGAGVT